MKPLLQLGPLMPLGIPPSPPQSMYPPTISPNRIVLLAPSGHRATAFRDL